MLKDKLNKILRLVGAEIHGKGYIEKLKNTSIDKSEWVKKAELLNSTASTIFDVGANRGDITTIYSSKFPNAKIYAFEPFETSAAIFLERHKNNTNVSLYKIALSNSIGVSTMFVNESVDTNSLLASKKIGATSDKSCTTVSSIEVPLLTVDEFCKENSISEIDILKLDVQGSELNVLKGSIKMLEQGKIKIIYTEAYFKQQYESQPLFYDLANFLLPYGFVLQDFYDPYYNNTQLLWCDALFVKN